MILADTDVLIDFLAGAAPASATVAAYAEMEQLQTTAVTCFELLSGASKGKRGDPIRRLVTSLSVLPLDREAAARAAHVRRDLNDAGLAIGMADSLIAGIALTHDLPLLTRNRKHFERISNLRLVPLEAPPLP